MRSLLCVLGAATLGTLAVLPAAGPAVAADSSFTLEDPRITESSGLAASRLHPGVYWTHNDSDDGPYVYAVDGRTGRTVATVTLAGIDPRDVEAVSAGPDGGIYVGDIGDNLGGTWPEVWIYRFEEPKQLGDTTVRPVRYTVQYEGGPRDAESLMVHPKTGRVYLVSKHRDGGGLYEGPRTLSASGVNTFRRIADVDLWATDGAFSPDGTRLVIRGYFTATAYRWGDGGPTRLGSPGLPMQRQGESVTFTSDGRALMYGTEGAGSQVIRVPLRGEELPESAGSQDERPPGAATEADEGTGPGGTDGASTDRGGSGSDENRNVVVGALTFAAATVLVVGLRRLLRRG
jgi:hypothetical protein